MPHSSKRRKSGALGIALALGLLGLGVGGCSEEQAAIGTIEMGTADKNNLMSFGTANDAAPAETKPRRGSRGQDRAVPIKSLKRGGGAVEP